MRSRQIGTTARPMSFLMVDSADHLTGKTGLTPTTTISKNGSTFAAPAGAVSEIGNGWYALAGNATDRDTLGDLVIHAESAGADPTDEKYEIVSHDPFAIPSAADVRTEMDANSTVLASIDTRVLLALPAAAPMAANGLPTVDSNQRFNPHVFLTGYSGYTGAGGAGKFTLPFFTGTLAANASGTTIIVPTAWDEKIIGSILISGTRQPYRIVAAGAGAGEVVIEPALNANDQGEPFIIVSDVQATLSALYDAAKAAASQGSVNTLAGYVDTEVAAIKARTDLIPNSPAAVGSQMSLDPAAITAIWQAAIDGGLDARETLAVVLAALAGKLSGAGTTEITIKAANGNDTRIVATVDTVGNRLAVVITPPA